MLDIIARSKNSVTIKYSDKILSSLIGTKKRHIVYT